MKNVNNTGRPDNGSALAIFVTIDDATFLKILVEKSAHRHLDIGYSNKVMPAGWQAVDSSAIEAYVSGNMDINGKGEHIALAYTTCFSFTCTKVFGQDNTLSWVNSLS